MVLRFLAIACLTALLTAGSDVPPDSLVRENVKKASAIVKGTIERSEAPHPGLTVAHFRISYCYRGPFKPGDKISYASFREADRYQSEYLHTNLVVFLRKRAQRFAPPSWETATDLSEFLYTPELETKLTERIGRSHQ
jgi:hypothetical protein